MNGTPALSGPLDRDLTDPIERARVRLSRPAFAALTATDARLDLVIAQLDFAISLLRTIAPRDAFGPAASRDPGMGAKREALRLGAADGGGAPAGDVRQAGSPRGAEPRRRR